jgi:hypothetical protein
MAARRFAPLLVLFALFGLLVSIPAPTGAQEKKDKPASKTGLDESTTALMNLVEEAIKAKDYRHDNKHGNGKTPYDLMPPKPGILVGLVIWPGTRDRGVQYLRGVQPIWLCKDGTKNKGKIVGNVGAGDVKCEAKAGYAVAGLKVHTEFGEIAGISLVYAKITDTGLDMSDTEESKYYGHNDPNTATKVVCTGDPILGIHGLVETNGKSHDFGLGLIVMGKDKKKKK